MNVQVDCTLKKLVHWDYIISQKPNDKRCCLIKHSVLVTRARNLVRAEFLHSNDVVRRDGIVIFLNVVTKCKFFFNFIEK